MRINFNYDPQPAAPETKSTSPQSAAAAGNRAAAGAPGEDQAQLSGGLAQVEALAAQAAQLPEVREERIQALRQSVESGSYHPSPESVASSMLDQMLSVPAA